jgi:hypothetical protein
MDPQDGLLDRSADGLLGYVSGPTFQLASSVGTMLFEMTRCRVNTHIPAHASKEKL